ncbi:uncharacterized protein LOC133361675 isoform X2 [Lethenteron reissneri]|uniref:uncharacterized protein LOC133361675 isoform X2 n=1 Tax=Lethenteron reissneri TaxID=7753 RepID=UPI002AB7474C|nr:uncharacterized protein LOC133361675 isoform X2 [Lethenteron reissneri]
MCLLKKQNKSLGKCEHFSLWRWAFHSSSRRLQSWSTTRCTPLQKHCFETQVPCQHPVWATWGYRMINHQVLSLMSPHRGAKTHVVLWAILQCLHHLRISIWVGNITSAVTEKMLQKLFRPFGQIHSIRILVDRKCAFVNYTDEEAAERALWSLQGHRVADTNLLIDFQSVSAKTIAAAFQQPSAVPPEHDEFTGLSP